jgi:serine/threonine protein kinase
MEFFPQGDLAKELAKRHVKHEFWDEIELYELFKMFIVAFATCQRAGVSHRDIKPANVFLTLDGKIKIADFGESRVYAENAETGTFCGTMLYIAPTLLKHYRSYSSNSEHVRHNAFKSDVFSLGLTFYHMAALRPPKNLNEPDSDLAFRIFVDVGKLRYSSRIKELLVMMLTVEEP